MRVTIVTVEHKDYVDLWAFRDDEPKPCARRSVLRLEIKYSNVNLLALRRVELQRLVLESPS